MNTIYTHISPNELPFSAELTHSDYTFVKIPAPQSHISGLCGFQ